MKWSCSALTSTIWPGHKAQALLCPCGRLGLTLLLVLFGELAQHWADTQQQKSTAMDHRVTSCRIQILAFRERCAAPPPLLHQHGVLFSTSGARGTAAGPLSVPAARHLPRWEETLKDFCIVTQTHTQDAGLENFKHLIQTQKSTQITFANN